MTKEYPYDVMPVKQDEVNHPSHYTKGGIEVYDFILDQKFNYEAGNIIKYICRYRYKGTPIKDLNKAKWYLEKLIKKVEKGCL